jgi:hypothetical protein
MAVSSCRHGAAAVVMVGGNDMHASWGRGGRVCGQCTAGASRPPYMSLPASCILMAVLAGSQHVQSMGHADAARNVQHCMLCIWLHWRSVHAVGRVYMPGWASTALPCSSSTSN